MAIRLLMIDDEVGLTNVVGLIARREGMEFRSLNSSHDATQVFLDYEPHVVMLDMIMPDKDGVAVLHEIMSTGVRTRFILTSGLSDAYLKLGQGVAAFHGNGEVRLLRKPFRRDELVELLKNLRSTSASL